MTTIDKIMTLDQRDLSDALGQPGSLAFIDVPVLENGRMVIVKDLKIVAADEDFSFVGPIASALQIEERNSAAFSAASSSLPLFSSSAASLSSVPEPSSICLLLLGVGAALRRPMGSRRKA
jgi:hypothetical protein